MKKEKDSFLKARIIISSIFLFIILGGWLIYGINVTYSNPTLVLQKVLKSEENKINNKISELKLDSIINKKININKDKDIFYYSDFNKDSIYFYNNTQYFDLSNYLKVKDIKINIKELNNKDNYKILVKSIKNVISKNIKLFDIDKKQDKDKKLYLYSYTLNEIEPLLASLKTDKEFMNTLNKIFGDSNKYLDMIKDNSFGISILTKGRKRELVHYGIVLENIINIKVKKDMIDGYISNYGIIINDNEITISTEDNNYDLIISDIDNFNIDNLEETAFDNILD